MSEGIRSGVNWMRLKPSDMVLASELTSSVLARPGTPTSRQWPRAKMAIIISSMTSSMPMMVLRSSFTIASLRFAEFLHGLNVVGWLGHWFGVFCA